ncbi:MAG: hypothetical protein JW856_06150 [Dehalococcoidales bacterium]|nr:hypothetical protein [Dehalococcoidales bacterium]
MSRVENSPVKNPVSSPPNSNLKKSPLFINKKTFTPLLSLLLIFLSTLIGVIIIATLHTNIPLWILLGFSLIFSVEKWFLYYTRKYKIIGYIYRTLLNCSLLASLGLLIWSGFKLFSHQSAQTPLIGSIILILELIFFIWICRVITKNSWRKPSMKLTVFSLIVLFLILAFAGVEPLSTYKDIVGDKIQSTFSSRNNNSGIINPTVVSTSVRTTDVDTTTTSQINISTQTTQTINLHTGVYKNYYLGLVDDPEGTLSGDGCYDDEGNFLILINNKDAVDPTYDQLVAFLRNDNTGQYPYTYTDRMLSSYYGTAESRVNLNRIKNIIDGITQPGNPCVCADFAERLHNNAEKAGIRCAYVSIKLTDAGHALCAFKTTDRGIVYIDVTGISNTYGPSSCDKIVHVQIGQEYIPTSLFPEPGWESTWDSMGTVTSIYLTWDGNWNN